MKVHQSIKKYRTVWDKHSWIRYNIPLYTAWKILKPAFRNLLKSILYTFAADVADKDEIFNQVHTENFHTLEVHKLHS